jgi:hypothetical protein
LFSFRRQEAPPLVRPISYQGKEGIWVAAIAFHITGFTNSLEGAAYLNPRSTFDLRLLHLLITQDRFPVLFFNPSLRIVISQATEWTVHQRQELRVMLAQAAYARVGDEIFRRETDPDFERAKQEFEKVYSIEKLLTLQTTGTVRASSPFRGAVLD